MPLGAGSILRDNVILIQELGRGAMGTVWLAENQSLGSHLAVKVLHCTELEEARIRFEQEARGVAQIDSPHVVKMYDYGFTEEGEPYIVMELLRGSDLSQRLDTHGPLTLPQTATVIRQLSLALSRAHQLGVIHRDLKPANLFLLDTGSPELFLKVLDFGVAKHLGDDMGMTSSHALMGTPYYMSPEQFVSPRTIDHRADLWSLAVVAYTSLVGSVPFKAETVGGLSLAVHKGQFPAPASVRRDLPASIDAWFHKSLQVDPAARYQTAIEASQAFDAAVNAAAHDSTQYAMSQSGQLPQPAQPYPAMPTGAPAHHSVMSPAAAAAQVRGPPPRRSRTGLIVGVMAAIFAAGLALTAVLILPDVLADDTSASEKEDGKSTAKKSKKKSKKKAKASTRKDEGDDDDERAESDKDVDGKSGSDDKSASVPTSLSAGSKAGPPSSKTSSPVTSSSGTIQDTTGLSSVLVSCWTQTANEHLDAPATATVSVSRSGGTTTGITIGGSAARFSNFQSCAVQQAGFHAAGNFGDRENGKTVVAQTSLPACVWDDTLQQHRCG